MTRFLATWLAALLAMTACVVALTVAVDPYGVLGTPAIGGLTAEKVAAADRPRLTKPYLIDRAPAATIVLGASNVDVGIDPHSPAWPAGAQPVFNLAIDGSQPEIMFRYLQHALVHSRPKRVLLGLAFEDAMIRPVPRLSASDVATYAYEQRLRVLRDGTANPGYTQARIDDLLFATLSTQALKDSLHTLLSQGDAGRNSQTAEGRNTGGSFVRWTREEGAHSLVVMKDREKAPQFLTWRTEPRLMVKPVADIVRLARGAGAEVAVFFAPTYVDEREIIRQTGLQATLERWKAEVAAVVEQAADGDAVPLWDFNTYSRYTTEPLPASGDKRPLSWFWEPIHFRKELGDIMVQRMVTGDGPADFGTRVTPATLPAALAADAARQQDWLATHPTDVARVAAAVEAAARSVCHAPLAACPQLPAPRLAANAATANR